MHICVAHTCSHMFPHPWLGHCDFFSFWEGFVCSSPKLLTPNCTCARLDKLWWPLCAGGFGVTLGAEAHLGAPPAPPHACSPGLLAPQRNREALHGIKLLITVINERGGSWAPWAGNPVVCQGSSCREWGPLGVPKQSWDGSGGSPDPLELVMGHNPTTYTSHGSLIPPSLCPPRAPLAALGRGR